jgi:hypothetical protein
VQKKGYLQGQVIKENKEGDSLYPEALKYILAIKTRSRGGNGFFQPYL